MCNGKVSLDLFIYFGSSILFGGGAERVLNNKRAIWQNYVSDLKFET